MQNLETEMTVFGQKFHELLDHCRNLEKQLRELKEQNSKLEEQCFQAQLELEQLKKGYENKVEQYIASIDAILNKGGETISHNSQQNGFNFPTHSN